MGGSEKGEGDLERKGKKREGCLNRTGLTKKKKQGSKFKKRNGGRSGWEVEVVGGLNDFPGTRQVGWAGRLDGKKGVMGDG